MSNPYINRVTKREDLERTCDVLAAMGAPLLPVFRAAADGHIELAVIGHPKTAWPTKALAKVRKPCLVIVSGDTEPEEPSVGPQFWRCARQIRLWAKSGIVHGAAGEPDHYRLAASLATTSGQAAMIETASRHVLAWSEMLNPVPVMLIVPPNGVSHPIGTRQEVRH